MAINPDIFKNSSQTKTLTKISSRAGQALTFLSIALFLPSVIHQQAITGPIINAVLLLSSLLLGPSTAMMIGLIPSVVALSRGLLPAPLAPVVPFIMISNALYIFVFSQLKAKNFATAVVAASIIKFSLLHFVSQFLLASLLPSKFLTPAANMMSWPQLVTALAGGFIAWVIINSTNLTSKN